jgi:hypothetical protein
MHLIPAEAVNQLYPQIQLAGVMTVKAGETLCYIVDDLKGMLSTVQHNHLLSTVVSCYFSTK